MLFAGIDNVSLTRAAAQNGALVLTNSDPQIGFTIKPYILTTSVLAQIRVEASSRDTRLTPKIYLDYGNGYAEPASIKMSPDGDGAWVCYIPIPNLLRRLRLDLAEIAATIDLHSIVAKRADLSQLFSTLGRIKERELLHLVSHKFGYGLALLGEAFPSLPETNDAKSQSMLADIVASGLNHIPASGLAPDDEYLAWIERYESLTETDRDWMATRSAEWGERITFSILMPVYDPPLDLLGEAIDSLQAQTYQHWELCLADDASTNDAVRDLIQARAAADSRIKYVFREENGHISRASNSAAELATGRYLVLMDNDDLLPPHALFTMAHYIDANPGCRMLFSDEDKISLAGFRFEPYHKGAFDRFLMYGHNMFSHLGVYERSLFESVGGFRIGYEGSQDYDLTLRCMEQCEDAQIVHVPHVLYHWRQVLGSTSLGAGQKSYAFEAAKKGINDHFERCGYPVRAVNAEVPGVSVVRALSQPSPVSISIVIPTRDGLDVLEPCIASLLANPDPFMQIVIVDNGSTRPETLEYFDGLASDPRRFKIVRDDAPFNFSRLVNLGVSHARGEIVCLLNNDTEVLSAALYERARAWLSMPDVGIVGARLLYPDMTLQHFGVYVGIGEHGVADHAHVGLHDSTHARFSKSRLLQQFSAVTAACLFVRKTDYLAVGGFDEELAVAYNDVDFCLKLRSAGLKVVCDPEIRLIHKESKSRGHDNTPSKVARLADEAARVRTRWADSLEDPFYSPNFSRANTAFELASKPRQRFPWKYVPPGRSITVSKTAAVPEKTKV